MSRAELSDCEKEGVSKRGLGKDEDVATEGDGNTGAAGEGDRREEIRDGILRGRDTAFLTASIGEPEEEDTLGVTDNLGGLCGLDSFSSKASPLKSKLSGSDSG